MMKVTKKDIIWGYSAQFFQIASGIIILPYVLRKLSTNEIAMNYIMLNIGSIVALVDFGFSLQFSKNFAYVFSGAQELQKDTVVTTKDSTAINYGLLNTLIYTAKRLYRVVSLLSLVLLLTVGTLYLKQVTKDFTLIDNVLPIWILYCASVFLNVYYLYLTAMLTGKGAITESRKVVVYSRIIYIVIAFVLLSLKLGLLSLVIANFLSAFVQRGLSVRYFYTRETKLGLKGQKKDNQEIVKCFKILWFNAKKIGIGLLGGFAINKTGMFFAGLYLSPSDVASYGLMIQFIGLASSIAITMVTIYQPKFASHVVSGDDESLKKDFALTMGVFYLLFGAMSIFLIFCGNFAFRIIHSNATFPAMSILAVYCLIQLLETNHSCFAGILVIKNKVPYVKPSLISGGIIIMGLFVILNFFNMGLWGLVLVPGIVQLCYNNWKWPYVVCHDFGTGIAAYTVYAIKQTIRWLDNGIKKFFCRKR